VTARSRAAAPSRLYPAVPCLERRVDHGCCRTSHRLPGSPAHARSDASRPAAARAGTVIKAWTADEKKLFVEGVALHGRVWDAVAAHIGSRGVPAVRSHAQGYFIKLCLAGKRVPRAVAESGGEGYTVSGKPLDPASVNARKYGLTADRLAGAPRPCAWRAAAAHGTPTRAWPAWTRGSRLCPNLPLRAGGPRVACGQPWRTAVVRAGARARCGARHGLWGLPARMTAARRGPRRGFVTSLPVRLRRAAQAQAGAARARAPHGRRGHRHGQARASGGVPATHAGEVLAHRRRSGPGCAACAGLRSGGV